MLATMGSSTNKNNIYCYDYDKHIQKYYLCMLNTNKKWKYYLCTLKEKPIILFMRAKIVFMHIPTSLSVNRNNTWTHDCAAQVLFLFTLEHVAICISTIFARINNISSCALQAYAHVLFAFLLQYVNVCINIIFCMHKWYF